MTDSPKQRKHQGLSQAQLLEVINPSWENARVWGAVYSHRQACIRYLRDSVLHMLDEPSMTRRQMKQEVLELCKRVEEHGP